MQLRLILIAVSVVGVLGPSLAAGPELSLDKTRRVLDASLAYADSQGAPGGAVAIVDHTGALVLFERLDGTFPAASPVSVGKARTAAAFQKPTKVFEDAINGGRTAMAALPDFFPLQGGVPLQLQGRVVGAIGVSGAASAKQDEEIAMAGAAALALVDSAADRSSASTHLEGMSVSRAFERGAPLVENGEFKVHASRRDGPGESEIHAEDTDIFYVLSGRATLVTGGLVTDERTVAPGEIRGSGIDGGQSRALAVGDVVVIPRGTPHWFKAVPEPMTYYVVKVSGGRS